MSKITLRILLKVVQKKNRKLEKRIKIIEQERLRDSEDAIDMRSLRSNLRCTEPGLCKLEQKHANDTKLPFNHALMGYIGQLRELKDA